MCDRKQVRVGVIGCGTISSIYLKNCSALFDNLKVIALADLVPERSAEKAAEFGVSRTETVEQILTDSEIDVILNLTIPKAHFQVSKAALEAGKHVYVEKPVSIDLQEGETLAGIAKTKGLLLGGAPDTFLGAGIQTCRKLIADGWIGKPVAATAFMLCGGHERWHPDPAFYYQTGGGPMFDMGPYYLTALVALLGPVSSLAGMTSTTWQQRTVTSQPKKGQIIQVEVPTHVSGLLQFKSGAQATIMTSFDIKGGHGHTPIEIYGTEGSLQVPDPNTFGGPVHYRRAGAKEWSEIPLLAPFQENSRGLGLSDLADALQTGRKPRACADLTVHVLELMHGIHISSETRKNYRVRNTLDNWD
jgi:predicted dehydrogenase